MFEGVHETGYQIVARFHDRQSFFCRCTLKKDRQNPRRNGMNFSNGHDQTRQNAFLFRIVWIDLHPLPVADLAALRMVEEQASRTLVIDQTDELRHGGNKIQIVSFRSDGEAHGRFKIFFSGQDEHVVIQSMRRPERQGKHSVDLIKIVFPVSAFEYILNGVGNFLVIGNCFHTLLLSANRSLVLKAYLQVLGPSACLSLWILL